MSRSFQGRYIGSSSSVAPLHHPHPVGPPVSNRPPRFNPIARERQTYEGLNRQARFDVQTQHPPPQVTDAIRNIHHLPRVYPTFNAPHAPAPLPQPRQTNTHHGASYHEPTQTISPFNPAFPFGHPLPALAPPRQHHHQPAQRQQEMKTLMSYFARGSNDTARGGTLFACAFDGYWVQHHSIFERLFIS